MKASSRWRWQDCRRSRWMPSLRTEREKRSFPLSFARLIFSWPSVARIRSGLFCYALPHVSQHYPQLRSFDPVHRDPCEGNETT
jgi:hypothetical protein